jgi:hypothetical protein
MEAVSILGREVLQPRGLIGLGFDSIDHCGPEIAEVGLALPLSLSIITIFRVSEHSHLSLTMGF